MKLNGPGHWCRLKALMTEIAAEHGIFGEDFDLWSLGSYAVYNLDVIDPGEKTVVTIIKDRVAETPRILSLNEAFSIASQREREAEAKAE